MLEWPWLTIVCFLAVPSIVFAVECLADAMLGGKAVREHAELAPGQDPSVCVLIPAHNECIGIRRTLQSIRPQLGPHDRMLVVADNCTDDTAQQARLEGAEVTERTHLTLRGKGYALDHGIAHLRSTPPQQVLMVDADCVLHPNGLQQLKAACRAHHGPVQCCDLMQARPDSALNTRIAEFAWLVKNHVRPSGAARLGWPCQLMGTGMIFPWSIISQAPLASGHLAEDMQLGAHLAKAGHTARYLPDALVTSRFPEKTEALSAQRRRWEHGHLEMIRAQGLPLLATSVKQRSWALAGLALDMCVPPLSSLVLLNLATVAISALGCWAFPVQFRTPLMVGLACLLSIGLAIMSTWFRMGRAIIRPKELFGAPVYMLRKLSIYASYISGRKSSWVRAERDQRND
jgi:cellulose synthase/poly-beta-1,6-N-acetylglucosamine synthase-like glycosyltransferase